MKLLSLTLLATLMISIAAPLRAEIGSLETILHNFSDGSVVSDGRSPFCGLVQGTDGNFYGTSQYGGSAGFGVAFKVTVTGGVTVLHSFGDGSVVNDGWYPVAALIQGNDGNFYGTTSGGGAGAGTVFRMSPSGGLTILHSFSLHGPSDPQVPLASLVQAKDGNFYGTTAGGFGGGGATVFKITPAGAFTVLHYFRDGTVANDGRIPTAPLIEDENGNFYGTTYAGGVDDYGSVFKMTATGIVTILHSFQPLNLGNSFVADGFQPNAGLVEGNDGNFYGTTTEGGLAFDPKGTVFKITPEGILTILHNFHGNDGSGVLVGQRPIAPLALGHDGNFYGTTYDGELFRITSSGDFTDLYDLGDGKVAQDGNVPNALIQAVDGNFYGTTQYGGSTGNGTIFKLAVAPLASAPVQRVIVHSGEPFDFNLSAYGFSGPYHLVTQLPNWLVFDELKGVFQGLAPDSALLAGVVKADAFDASGHQVEVPFELYLVRPVIGTDLVSLDLGSVAVSGQTSFDPTTGLITMKSSGNGLKDSEAGYQLAYGEVTGDFVMTAEIEKQSGGGETGIIVKDELTQFSSHVAVVVKSGAGTQVKYNSGSSEEFILGQDLTQTRNPAEVALARSGNTLTAYELTKSGWVQLASKTFTYVPSTLFLGLTESADHNGVTATGLIRAAVETITAPIVGGAIYKLVPVNAPQETLDVNRRSRADGAKIQIWKPTGGTNQEWKLIDDGGGYYELAPQSAPGSRLDLTGKQTRDGTKVEQQKANGGSSQKWKFIYNNRDDSYELEPMSAPGQRLDVDENGQTNGTQVIIWHDHGGKNQHWRLVPE